MVHTGSNGVLSPIPCPRVQVVQVFSFVNHAHAFSDYSKDPAMLAPFNLQTKAMALEHSMTAFREHMALDAEMQLMKENAKGVVDHEHGGNIIHNPHDRMVVSRIMSHVHATFDAKEAALTNAVTAHDILSVRYSHALVELEDHTETINELEGLLQEERELGAKTKKALKSKIADQADVNMRIMNNAKKLRRNQLKDTKVHGSRISTLQEQLNQRNEELAKTRNQLDMALEDSGHQEAHFRKYVDLKKAHAKLQVLHTVNKARLGRTVESLSKAEGGLRQANELLMKLESNAITHRRHVSESRKASVEALEQYSDLYYKFEAMFDKTEAATQVRVVHR